MNIDQNARWYEDIYQWLPIFLKDIRRANPRFFDKKIELDAIEWYDSDPTFKEFADQQYELRKEKYSEQQSISGKLGVVSRWDGVSEEERSNVCSKGGTSTMKKRREDGSLYDFQSLGGKIAWQDNFEKMYTAALKNLEKANKAAYKRVICPSCGKNISQATFTRWHAMDSNNKCRLQIAYESLPDKFTLKDIEDLIIEIPGLLIAEKRIKVLYKPSTVNQFNPTIYCKEDVYEDLIKQYKNKKTPKEMVLQNLPTDKEFSGKYLREICEKFEYKSPKKILKQYCITSVPGRGTIPAKYKLV